MARDYVIQPFRPPAELQIDYRGELNDEQYAAVSAGPGPALVIAGAGSGKTRTLTYRVAWLIEHGIAAERILLLTFTNKAAREMMGRVGDLLGDAAGQLWGGTFHSIGARVLRRHAERLGFRPDFTILDREDSADLVKACLGESEFESTATRFPKPDVLVDLFSKLINTGRELPELLAQDYSHFQHLAGPVEQLRRNFTERKRRANVMDFDDLLALWLRLLRDDPEIRERYQRTIEYILVDEYQDTNTLQGELIDVLAARHHNVMVVGDDSQSIYAWRGANFRNILDFPRRHAGTKVYKIETNYRSTPEILELANAAIAPNTDQFAKRLVAARPSGLRPGRVICTDGAQQAAFVAQRILELRDEGVSLAEVAVLYRSHFHALEIQLELTRRNIPFLITSGIRFFEQAHIKDVSAWLKLLVNPSDELAFKRLVQLLPGIGAKGAEKLWRGFMVEGLKAESAVTEDGAPPPRFQIAVALQACAGLASKKAATAWASFATTFSQLETGDLRTRPQKIIQTVLEADYEDYLQENFTNWQQRRDDLEQLAVFAGQFSNVEEFLTQLSLLTNLEADNDVSGRNDDERVRLTTIHQAKGLEFDAVFVIMLCEGLFPSQRSLENPAGLEEERRLFYVAVTRARNELYLCCPLMRFNPNGGEFMQLPSQFIDGLPKALVEEWNLRSYG